MDVLLSEESAQVLGLEGRKKLTLKQWLAALQAKRREVRQHETDMVVQIPLTPQIAVRLSVSDRNVVEWQLDFEEFGPRRIRAMDAMVLAGLLSEDQKHSHHLMDWGNDVDEEAAELEAARETSGSTELRIDGDDE